MQPNNKSSFWLPSVARRPWGQIALGLNIFPVPGLGSIIAGIKGRHATSVVLGAVLAVVNVVAIALNYIKPADWIVPTVFVVWGLSIILGIGVFVRSK